VPYINNHAKTRGLFVAAAGANVPLD